MRIRGANWNDAEAVVALTGAANGTALERLRAEWEHPDFQLGVDNLVAESPAGELAGYAAVSPAGELVLVAPGDTLADELYSR